MPAGVAALCSCGLFQELQPSSDTPPGHVEVEADRVLYDGEVLRFRILLGATDGGVVIDRRLIESIHVDPRSVQDCATGAAVGFWYADWFAPPPSGEDLLLLEPGYWFGGDLTYPFFPREEFPDGGPRCIDVRFAVRPYPSRYDAWEHPLDVRAEHLPPDAGVVLAPDAGR